MDKQHFDQSDRDILTTMVAKLDRAISDISELRKTLDDSRNSFATKEQCKDYVTYSDFGPVQKLVYGFAGIILTTVVGALVYLVIQVK